MRLRLTLAHTVETLASLRSQLGNCKSGNSTQIRRDLWLQWWSNADRQVRNLFADTELATSLQVSAERVRNLDLAVMPMVVLNWETEVWEERLDQVGAELKALAPFIDRPGCIVVPDTSAFLEGVYFTDLDWHALTGADAAEAVRLVIPVLVVEELDAHKRGRDRQRDRAISTLRRLWELGGTAPDQVAAIPGRDTTVEIFLDGAWHARRPVNDDEIIERALTVGEFTGRSVILAAADYSMLYRAAAVGLSAVPVPRQGDDDAALPPA